MCVAVVKPKFAEFPTKKELNNCFDNNPNGAGYMFIDNGQLHIKKGFMNFESFYDSFSSEEFTKDEPVFIHFRIATHGLVDSGNTHPFPITDNIQNLRSQDLKFNGFGLMHNGIFSYNQNIFDIFDKQHIISDTMLFDMIINYYLNKDYTDLTDQEIIRFYENNNLIEEAIAIKLKTNTILLDDFINNDIGYNKVAIMDSNGNIEKFGHWQEHNGCFYSNSDYEEKVYNYCNCINYNYNDEIVLCDVCGKTVESKNLNETTFGYVCDECIQTLPVFQCGDCGVYDLIGEKEEHSNKCTICRNKKLNDYCCDLCHQKSNNYILMKDNKLYCRQCYNQLKSC